MFPAVHTCSPSGCFEIKIKKDPKYTLGKSAPASNRQDFSMENYWEKADLMLRFLDKFSFFSAQVLQKYQLIKILYNLNIFYV